MTARPISRRPTPSRRCSGSRSRAVRPMLRAAAPRRGRRRARPRRRRGRAARRSGRPDPGRCAPRAERAGRPLAGRRRRRLAAGTSRDRVLEPALRRARWRLLERACSAPRPRRGRRTGRHGGDPTGVTPATPVTSKRVGPATPARAPSVDSEPRRGRAASGASMSSRRAHARRRPAAVRTRTVLRTAADRQARAQASMTTGMIIGRRRWALLTQRPTTRRTVCWSW